MGKKTSISAEKQVIVAEMIKNGIDFKEISKTTGISLSSVYSIKDKVRKNSPLKPQHRTNKARKTSAAQDRIITRVIKENRKSSRKEICSILLDYGIEISIFTLTRRLKEFGYGFRRNTKKFLLTSKMVKSRQQWLRKHKDWSQAKWNLCAFSDEATVELGMDRKSQCIRQIGEKYNIKCIQQRVKFPAKVMVWSYITSRGLGPIVIVEGMVNADKYMEILDTYLFPTAHQHFKRTEKWIFQQDSAPCHTAKKVKEYFRKKKIELLEWPGNSPDFSPIENVWTILKNEVAKKFPKTKAELIDVIKYEWENNPRIKEAAKKAMESMPARIKEGLRVKGCHTKW